MPASQQHTPRVDQRDAAAEAHQRRYDMYCCHIARGLLFPRVFGRRLRHQSHKKISS